MGEVKRYYMMKSAVTPMADGALLNGGLCIHFTKGVRANEESEAN